MSDGAYIPPSERRITSNESLTVPCGCGHCLSCEFGHGTATIHRRITFDDHGLLASHAVVDSIAAEAISILRMEPTLDHSCDLEEWDESCNECRFIRKARAVVERFDNLTKGTE